MRRPPLEPFIIHEALTEIVFVHWGSLCVCLARHGTFSLQVFQGSEFNCGGLQTERAKNNYPMLQEPVDPFRI